MQITSINVTLANEGKLRAYAVIAIDDSLAIHGLRLIEGENGFFVSMPSRKLPDGRFIDLVHPINPQTRAMIEERVLAEYRRLVGKSVPTVPPRPQNRLYNRSI
jgi:stage V sporulation protein G